MMILEQESLAEYTTIRIGGVAKKMYIPENAEELQQLLQAVGPRYFLGGGSNLLINDREFDHVVNLRRLCTKIRPLENGFYEVGASVRLQSLVKTVNEAGFGGIEYLYSVPGLFGGAVAMNAGGGREQGFSISDHIRSVTALYRGRIVTLDKMQCGFAFRDSVFKNNRDFIVLEAVCEFEKGSPEFFGQKRRERMEYCRTYHDAGKPNFGSVFRCSSLHIMKLMQKTAFGVGDIHFSKKTSNWLINEGNGTFSQAYALLKCVMFFHRLLKKDCELEIIVWK